MDDIAFKFLMEFPYPRQIIGILREPTYLPQWLTIQHVPTELHKEAIALITETAQTLLATR
jgi:hypothetical protein